MGGGDRRASRGGVRKERAEDWILGSPQREIVGKKNLD